MDLNLKKSQNFHKNAIISVRAFRKISVTKIATPPTFFNIFTSNFELWFLTKFGSYLLERFLIFYFFAIWQPFWRHFPGNGAKMAAKWHQSEKSKIALIDSCQI